jgi:hypothetical protein
MSDGEQAIETELLVGNMPAFLTRLAPVALSANASTAGPSR